MTVQKAINNIYSYFAQDNRYILDLTNSVQIKDIIKTNLIITELDDGLLRNIFILAAEDLEKMDFLKKIDSNRWVLKTEVKNLNQNIEISGQLACALAELNNDLSKKTNLSHLSNPMKITENDISFLVIYVSELLLNTKEEK